MGQLQHLSDSLERARSQYDASTAQLQRIQRDLRENKRELRVARHNLKQSQPAISARLVSLYTSEQTSTLEVILGARSLDDMINRLDNAKSVTNLDANVLGQVKIFRTAVQRNRAALTNARQTQERVVAERAAAKQAIASKLAQQQSLLSSIKGQIASMVAAEQARQLQMARPPRRALAPPIAASQLEAADTVVGITAVRRRSVDRRRSAIELHAVRRRRDVGARQAVRLGRPPARTASTAPGSSCTPRAVGKSLPHSTYALYSMGAPVSQDQLEPGDLVFFDGLGHVGIYIGGGQFVHAPHTGDVVKVSSLSEGWYASSYVGARRIL